MASIKIICTTCKKLFKQKGNPFQIGNRKVILGECGHFINEEQLDVKNPRLLESFNGEKLFEFQSTGVEHIARSNGRDLIADEMGLGKTVQALAFIGLYKDQSLPALYVVKSKLKKQWLRQHLNWIGPNYLAQIIDTTSDIWLPNFSAYIVSYDLLWRIGKVKLLDTITKLGIKTVVLDECQQIKNIDSKRTREVMNVCGLVPQVIGLSGTPFKNHIMEYFPILNILQPAKFPTVGRFAREWTETYWDHTSNKLRSGKLRWPEHFVKETSEFVIRREREEVMPDLPKIFRQFTYHDLADEVKDSYAEYMEAFLERYESEDGTNKQMDLLAYMSKMRHLTGLSKIDPAIDIGMELLGSSERKIVYFAHHQDVEYLLQTKLNSLLKELEIDDCLSICQKDVEETDKTLQQFIKDDKKRVLIASQLASGEGLDGLQKIDCKCIMLERQWNPANEEQVEGRFSRIGSIRDSVDPLYLVAIGTIDEMFAKIVERKRAIVKSALKGVEMDDVWDETGMLEELAKTLAEAGKAQWRL